GLVARNIYADFLHGLDDDRIELAGLESGAVGLKLVGAHLVQEGFGHLAAGAVVDANEKDSLSIHIRRRFYVVVDWAQQQSFSRTQRQASMARQAPRIGATM